MRTRRSGRRTCRRATDLRTLLATVDPGLTRLRLAAVAVASMVVAVAVTAGVRATLAPDEPVTMVLFAGALAMISNLAVNEPELHRRRVTTALMVLPAAVSTAAGTLLAPYRIVAAVVFVLVMMGAVWVRRYGPRGFALGMAAFMPYFFTQFLAATPAQLPWLLGAAAIGVGSTLVLRGAVVAERPERTLRRLVGAFRARAWVTIGTVDDVLAAMTGDGVREADLEDVRRARARLNATALLVEDQLEQTRAGRVWPGLDDTTLALRVFDAELALERLTVSVRRLAHAPGTAGPTVATTPGEIGTAGELTALRTGLAHLQVALSAGTPHDAVVEATTDARGAVAGLVADTRPGGERLQRVAFAVRRIADAVHHAQRDAPARSRAQRAAERAADTGVSRDPGFDDARREEDGATEAPMAAPDDDRGPPGLALSTRQAVQVGVGASLAIVVGELVAPARWYWAVIAAFVVFAGTQSRGDLLGRGWARIVGTAAGVAAGMGLAVLVAGNPVAAGVLIAVCVFLALYLVHVSPAMLAFWITAVLALVYGLIGQFSVATLLLRIEETVIGSVASILAGFLVLPRGTRAAFADAVDELVDVMDDVLRVALARLGGDREPVAARARAREMDTALATLRERARPLSRPAALRRGRSSHQRGLRVLTICDHYTRSLARISDSVSDPTWRNTLAPAGERVRANLDALRTVLVAGPAAREGPVAGSAEDLVDAAEAHAAASGGDPHRRTAMLTATRLLRRVDQAVVRLAVDLGAAVDGPADEPGQSPNRAASDGFVKTRSGS